MRKIALAPFALVVASALGGCDARSVHSAAIETVAVSPAKVFGKSGQELSGILGMNGACRVQVHTERRIMGFSYDLWEGGVKTSKRCGFSIADTTRKEDFIAGFSLRKVYTEPEPVWELQIFQLHPETERTVGSRKIVLSENPVLSHLHGTAIPTQTKVYESDTGTIPLFAIYSDKKSLPFGLTESGPYDEADRVLVINLFLDDE